MPSTREILEKLISGELSIEDAHDALKAASISELDGIAVLDTNRDERSGVPEVVLAESKDADGIVSIARRMVERKGYSIITRLDGSKVDVLKEELPDFKLYVEGAGNHLTAVVHEDGWEYPAARGKVGVLTAGTSDIPYAKEAEVVIRAMGVTPISFYDVGIAGIHRLVEPLQRMVEEKVAAIVVMAGMEGALPTVIASLVDAPVIGVPIPTGYGHGGAGETALAAMLQSCAPGLAVVNIGNGVGAGAMAALIAKRCNPTK
ncbi:nickel pincer cofactor biosynthesis protein LarB [Candidatus Thorarchaeota archaeon]|nr:MAG: nickel pincer cofactor biosynthesis protein LarB [Candidatus Thorarchaeota archaeon]